MASAEEQEMRPQRIFLVTIALILFSSYPLSVQADSARAKSIRHVPIKSSQLPAPGVPLTLSFDLNNFRGVIARERLLAVRDGKLLDIPLLEGPLPGADYLTHNAQIHSPLVELRYQAVITLSDGTIINTPFFSLRRTCIPTIELSPIDDSGSNSVQDRIKLYVQQATDLERDLTQYEAAAELLESLVSQVKEDK